MKIQVTPEYIKNTFAEFANEPGFEESSEIFEKGALPVEMIQALSLRPDILKGFAQMNVGVYPEGLIERPLKEKVILWVSRKNECQFCSSSHDEMAAGIGMKPEEIQDLTTHLSPREAVALEYTKAILTDSNRIPDSIHEKLRSLFTNEEIVELTTLVGWINLLNWFNNALEVRYRQDYST